jgi:phage gpG-like protein
MTKTLTLLGAVELFSTLGLEMEHHNHEALEKGAELVQKQAKDYIGTYDVHTTWTFKNGSTGAYSWPPLAESTKKDRVNKGFSEDEPLLRTGELRDSINITVGHNEASIGSNNDKAVWHELGTSRVPPRPFLEPALKEKTPKVLDLIGRQIVGKLSGTER